MNWNHYKKLWWRDELKYKDFQHLWIIYVIQIKLYFYSYKIFKILLDTIENFKYLELLDLSRCDLLESLLPSIGELKSLQEIVIDGCIKIEELLISIKNLCNLKKL